LWIQRIQSGARQYNWRYSAFIPALQEANIQMNRKVLADLAANEPFAFKAVVDVVNQTTTGAASKYRKGILQGVNNAEGTSHVRLE
jgi:hypothetical protein